MSFRGSSKRVTPLKLETGYVLDRIDVSFRAERSAAPLKLKIPSIFYLHSSRLSALIRSIRPH